jgi:hypothetical protein
MSEKNKTALQRLSEELDELYQHRKIPVSKVHYKECVALIDEVVREAKADILREVMHDATDGEWHPTENPDAEINGANLVQAVAYEFAWYAGKE